jgi:AraC family transcriptional regulator
MHLYLSDKLFEIIATEDHIPSFDRRNIRYLSGLCDPSLIWLGSTILKELRECTSVGGPLVETLSLCLAERMVLNYTDSVARPYGRAPQSGLDSTRLRRVLDYIHERLGEPISVLDMAAVACLSPFHFARAFRTSMGQSPHRYLSYQRLELAKRLLSLTDTGIAEISYLCQFSSPANFSRAFRSATGLPPRTFRHRRA